MEANQLIDQRWLLVHLLGEGTFGAVWLARDARFAGRAVAVKVLKPQFTAVPEVVQRFETEAVALGHLHHANIVQVLDRGAWQGAHYFVMEHIEGVTLRDRLDALAAQGQPLSVPDAAALFDQACAGVAAAHRGVSAGPVVHRDLKPSNLMLAQDLDGTVHLKILDFGIAQLGGRQATRSGAMLGTLNYMAPEQLLGETRRVGPASDVFALGVILLEMLTFRRTFDEETSWGAFVLRRESALADVLAATRADVPAALWGVIVDAMRAQPEQRPPNADVLRAAVREAVGLPGRASQSFPGGPLSSPGLPPTLLTVSQPGARVSSSADAFVQHNLPTKTLPPRGRRWLPHVALALVAASAAAASLWLKRRERDTAASPPPTAAHRPPPSVAPCGGDTRLVPSGTVSIGAGRVEVAAFCLDATEVTAARYRAFVGTIGGEVPGAVRWRNATPDDHLADRFCTGQAAGPTGEVPINCVDWVAARAYCAAAGAELPTEAQWERALRSRGAARYPWGDRAATAGDLNACGGECIEALRRLEPADDLQPLFDGADPFAAVAPGGRFERDRTPEGIVDLAGNVSEWVLDSFDEAPGAGASRDPTAGEFHVVRGGSWKSALPQGLDLTHRRRVRADVRDVDIGFRCASRVRAR